MITIESEKLYGGKLQRIEMARYVFRGLVLKVENK